MRTLVAAMLVVSALAAVGGIAYAAIPDASGVIHGCRNEGSGILRVIDAATESCRPSETALDWNQQGPKGEPGGLVDIYLNRDIDVLPAGAVRGYGIGCGAGDKPIGGGFDSSSTDVTAFRSDVDVANNRYVLGLNNRGSGTAAIQFTAYCMDLTP